MAAILCFRRLHCRGWRPTTERISWADSVGQYARLYGRRRAHRCFRAAVQDRLPAIAGIAGHVETEAIVKDHDVVPVEERLKFFDAVMPCRTTIRSRKKAAESREF